MKIWIILLISIIAETFATSMIKASEGLTKILPVIGIILGYAISFYGLSQVVKVMNLGVAYSIWAGLGICMVSIISFLFYKQHLDFPALLGGFFIITGVVIIQLFSETVKH
ncbi:DMT family transporter [Klebsiella pneumoniae]